MAEPTAVLQALRASTANLLKSIGDDGWGDDDVRAPSLLPGWTRAHVLTHLARNADGVAGTLAGALRGETVALYPDGPDSRAEAIEAGAGRPVQELVSDVTGSAERLDRVFGALADGDRWEVVADRGSTARQWLAGRLSETELHRVDLAGGYGPDQWPSVLVEDLLPQAAETLAGRSTDAMRVTITDDGPFAGRQWRAGDGAPVDVRGPDWAVLAWLTGRGRLLNDELSAQPPLGPWR